MGVPFLSSFLACFEWCVRVLEAETLIGPLYLVEEGYEYES